MTINEIESNHVEDVKVRTHSMIHLQHGSEVHRLEALNEAACCPFGNANHIIDTRKWKNGRWYYN